MKIDLEKLYLRISASTPESKNPLAKVYTESGAKA